MFNKLLVLIFLAQIFVVFPVFSKPILAQEGPADIRYEQVNPRDGFSYAVKRLQEKTLLWLYFLFPEKKFKFYSELAGRRLAELKFIIENKDMAYFENATTRYFSNVGEYVNFVLKNDKLKKNKREVEDLLLSHLPTLERLRDVFDPPTAEWRFVEDDINYVKIYINSLKNN